MLDKIFIEQAKYIRREYIKNSKEISECESKIESYKDELNDIQSELNEKMNENELLNKLILVEKNIKAIENIIQPHIDKIKKLEKEADKLFDSIKEKHTTLTSEDIKNELVPHLMKINF